jgi:hypothetical protein
MQRREHSLRISTVVLDALILSRQTLQQSGVAPSPTPALYVPNYVHASIATTVPAGSVRNHFKNSPCFKIDDRPP